MYAIGWLDKSRMLVNQYTDGRFGPFYSQVAVVNPNGEQLATSNLPELNSIQPLNSDWIYSADTNTIFSVNTGQAVWTGPHYNRSLPAGAATNTEVVYEALHSVVIESYP